MHQYSEPPPAGSIREAWRQADGLRESGIVQLKEAGIEATAALDPFISRVEKAKITPDSQAVVVVDEWSGPVSFVSFASSRKPRVSARHVWRSGAVRRCRSRAGDQSSVRQWEKRKGAAT